MLYPENTSISFKKALELNVDFIAFDVRQTKDGEPVIIHNEKIDRTTDGTGFVRDMTLKEIKKYDAGAWKVFLKKKFCALLKVQQEKQNFCGLISS
ncbi:MAG: hypothetical protein NC937_02250 [Candidatus Omnitrophica bacterium]|nr:hypothetical protein [Candidatus Omnitrophota bacterium]MCM8824965.1 hypothetical protein [Candidatus Omnitrophota bacterium]